jgi:hypothetical protein
MDSIVKKQSNNILNEQIESSTYSSGSVGGSSQQHLRHFVSVCRVGKSRVRSSHWKGK